MTAAQRRSIKNAQRGAKRFWSSMTPKERRVESVRRYKKGHPYRCTKCKKRFSSAQRLASHVRFNHPTKESLNATPKPGQPGYLRYRAEQKQDPTQDFRTAYAFGHVQAWLEVYADSTGLSRTALAHGVGELLLIPPSGKLLGA